MKNSFTLYRASAPLRWMLLLCLLTLGLSHQSNAQSFYWNFGTSSGDANPTGSVTGVVSSAVSQGNNNGVTTLLTTTSASNTYGGASAQFNAGAAARTGVLNTAASGSAYFELTMTPNAGHQLTLTGISFGTRSTSTGPQAYALRSSLDGYTSDLATGTISNTSVWALKSNSGLFIAGGYGTAVTFRVYGYSGTGSAAANTANWRIDDLTITLTSSCDVPVLGFVTTDPSSGVCNDGAVNLTVTGGVSPYTYAWSNGASTEDLTGVTAGTYTVTVTATGGCSASSSAIVNPVSATELCNGIDDDCDGSIDEGCSTTVYYADADGDTYGNPSSFIVSPSPTPPSGYVLNNTDCNDGNAAVNPAATEICNAIDDDCDGSIDEGLPITHYFLDADGDTYGSAFGSIFSCLPAPPPGYISRNNDCNDNNAAVNPLATEVCNTIDDDCDGVIDEGVQSTFYQDFDGDTYGNNAVSTLACAAPSGYVTNNNDCNDNNAAINPAATEVCNGLDDDCDNFADNGITFYYYYADADGDNFGNASSSVLSCSQPSGYVLNNTDCNDNSNTVYPGAPEVCNNVDDDCDGVADDGLIFLTYYTDADGDNYGTGAGVSLCANPGAGYSQNDGDCDDNNGAINPGATEICNGGIDDDCDGLADDADGSVTGQGTYYADADGDTYGAGAAILACIQPNNTSVNNTDCNDADGAVNPGATEVCNFIDDDCNGSIDDGLTFTTYYLDGDGDGYGAGVGFSLCSNPGISYSTVNGDCNDADGAVNPGATEICNNIDDDCNGSIDDGLTFITYYVDGDGDGYGAGAGSSLCSNPGAGYSTVNGDCNDADGAVNPGATEICNNIDDDCNGSIDDGLTFVTYFADADNDTYGDASSSVSTCNGAPSGYVSDNTDCNDNNAAINPAATEICDGGIDNDCDGLADDADGSVTGQGTYYTDADGDTYGAGPAILACLQPNNTSVNNTDCNDADGAVNPGATEICNNIDDDCNGSIDDGLTFITYYADVDGDGFGDAGSSVSTCNGAPSGYVSDNTDCNDNNIFINPSSDEICNGGIDDDCDGLIDDFDPSITGQGTYYADADGDTYGAGAAILACIQPNNTSVNNTDCNDADGAVNPGATEICNNIDDDCNGSIDDGLTFTTYYVDGDGDGYGAGIGSTLCSNPGAGYSTVNGDCNDADGAVNPGATEICNNIDDDCNGSIDDGLTFQDYFADNDGDTYGGSFIGNYCQSPGGSAVLVAGDCNDADPAVNPAAVEICNNVDDDCNGLTDDGLTFTTYYADVDGDTYGNPLASQSTCNGAPFGYILNSGDCDDMNSTINPAATEICNGVDDDCDGIIDGGTILPLGAISGPAQACIPVAFGTATFSVIPVSGITTYTWTLPAGLTIVSGQGSPTIFVSWTATAAHDGIAGTMSVVGSNNCGGGAPVTVNVDMHYTVPVRPPSISGNNRLCPGDFATYSVSLVARATSYTWAVPAGMTILTGQGTNIITVSVGAGFGGGSIDVYGSNVCGNGAVRTKTVAQNILTTPGAISGQATGLCGASGIIYSTSGVIGASSYTWSVPAGATITGGQGTTSITVDFSGSFNTGAISVYGNNTCGSGSIRSLTVIGRPNGPGPVTGSVTICPGATNVMYEVSTVAGASSYTWVAPNGASIASGQGSKTVYVNYGVNPATNLTISLTATNACGTSAVRVLGGISVNSSYCGPRVSNATDKFTNVTVYPNPATEQAAILFTAEEGSTYTLTVSDISGRVIYTEAGVANGGDNTKTIDVSTFEGGLYILGLERAGEQHQIRLIVE